jgi:hypothetical protein
LGFESEVELLDIDFFQGQDREEEKAELRSNSFQEGRQSIKLSAEQLKIKFTC